MTAPLAQMLEHYEVRLPRSYGTTKLLCPIHSEDNPSCSVDLDAGLFHCFSCGAAGDAYTLVMLKEPCDFASAKRIVEEVVGESDGGVRGGSRRRRRRVPQGEGFRPRYHREVPARARARRSWD